MGTDYISYATNTPRKVHVGNFVQPQEALLEEKVDEIVDVLENEVQPVKKQSEPIGVEPQVVEKEQEMVDLPQPEPVQEPTENDESGGSTIFIRMRLFTFVIALTAFVIAGCAAYFSVSGLATLFAGAFWSIVVMGGILEFGKLIATSFLYRYWKHTSFFLKSYLMIAIFVLMVITSLGIFGYLSRAHIEQQGNIQNAEVIVQRIDIEIAREQSKIDNLNTRVIDIKADTADYSDSIVRQESIRDAAWDMVQTDIDFEQTQIRDIQSNLTAQLESLDNKYQLDIQDLNSEQDRIETELQLISNEERGLFSQKQTERKDSLRERQSEVIAEKDRLRNKLGDDKQILRDESSSRLSVHQENITKYRQQAQQTIDVANERINELRQLEDDLKTEDIASSQDLQSEIDEIYKRIDTLTDEKFDAETKVRLVEAEVGPIKYVAEAVYGDTERSTIEKAVRMLIIMIVFVFDPLAVSLVLAYNSLIVMNREQYELREKKEKSLKKANFLHNLKNKVKTKSGSIKNFKGEEIVETEKK